MSVETEFSCADLLVIQAKQGAIFNDENMRPDIIPYTAAAQALVNAQTAELIELKDPEKDKEYKLSWIVDCAEEIEPYSGECDWDGEEATVHCDSYGLREAIEAKFKTSTNDFRTSTYSREEFMARQILRRKKILEEQITQYMINKLIEFHGTNLAPTPFEQDGDITYIPPVSMNGNLMGYIYKMMIKNKIPGGFLLTGDNLFLSKWQADMEAGNANGKGEKNKLDSLPVFFDLFNVDAVSDKSMFLVSPNAYAFVSKTRFPRTPIYIAGQVSQWRWNEPSRSIPGLSFDMIYTMKCDGTANNNLGDIKHLTKIIARFDMHPAPRGCDDGRTGIIHMQCGSVPA